MYVPAINSEDTEANGPLVREWVEKAIADAYVALEVTTFAFEWGKPVIHLGAMCGDAEKGEKGGRLQHRARLEEALIALLPTLEGRVPQLCLDCCEGTDALLHDIAECDWTTVRFADQPARVYCTPKR
jgi:hypothetical protein